MSQLSIPAAAFVLDLCQQAFPQNDWSRGSAVSDLVVKAFGTLMQPLMSQIDSVKVNSSLSNWQYMTSSDLDAIAANWGTFRQTGGYATGTVRIIFASAVNTQLNSLVFTDTTGNQYVLSTPVSIPATQLFSQSLSNGTFYADVTVQSVGIGSAYALPANSIVGIVNPPANIISATNPNDFAVTAPNQSGFDVVNGMFKNLGLRNLVSRQAIRAPLLANFPGIQDIYVAGAGDPNMLRDLITVQLSSGAAELHTGGTTDVWLNTTSVSNQTVSLSYVPSSLAIQIVSAAQAQANALIFSFTRGQYSVDGVFSNPDVSSLDLDESASVQFNINNVPQAEIVIGDTTGDRVQLANSDIISGSDLLYIPGPAGQSPYVADLTSINFFNTAVVPGNYILIGNGDTQLYKKINNASGRILELAPTIVEINDYLYSGSPLTPGTLQLNISDIGSSTSVYADVRINDRFVLPSTPAAGEYTVLGLTTNTVNIGKLVASGEVTYVGSTVINSLTCQIYNYTGPTGGTPLLPPSVDTTHSLYFGTDCGYIPSNYFPIVSLVPGSSVTVITVLDPSGASITLGSAVSVIQGLAGALPTNTTFSVMRDNGQPESQDQIQSAALGHSKYANVTPVVTPIGATTLQSVGIGALCSVGDFVEFIGLTPAPQFLSQLGGDGSRVTVVITAASASPADVVTFTPALPFAIPAGTAFSVIRNNLAIGTAVVTSVSGGTNTFTIAGMPPGLGDGQGLIIEDPANNYYASISASAGNIINLTFNAPVNALTIVFDSAGYVSPVPGDAGKTVKQIFGSTTYTGTLFSFNNSTFTWVVIPATPADLFSDTSAINVSVIGSFAAGQIFSTVGPSLVGYTPAVSGDIGQLVRQGTFTGILQAYNNGTYTWSVQPLSSSDLFSSTTSTTFVDYSSSGYPVTGHGSGTLSIPGGPVVLGGGPVTFTLNTTPLFTATQTVTFYSRFGRNAGMFNGSGFGVTTNGTINPSSPFAGVVVGTHDLVILSGVNQGVYPITQVAPYSLSVSGALAAEFVHLPNSPGAQTISGAMLVGTTSFTQTGVGLWGAPGRAIVIEGAGITQVYIIASVTSTNTVVLEGTGLITAIQAASGATYEVVEALNTPYWIIPDASLKPYRIIDVDMVGDVLEASAGGSFSDVSPTAFNDLTVNFGTLLINADLASGDYVLVIDSGSQASSVPITITGVTGLNSITLDTEFPVSESNVSYHVVRFNNGRSDELWLDGVVQTMSAPINELILSGPRTLTFEASGYVSPSPADIGNIVTQTVSGVATSIGILKSYDANGMSWKVLPLSSGYTFSDTSAINVTIAGSAGTGQLSIAPTLFDFARYGSRLMFDVTIVPHPSWVPPGGWITAYGANWTMPQFTGSFDPATQVLTLDINTAPQSWTYTATNQYGKPDAVDSSTGGIELVAGSLVRVCLRLQDRTSADQLNGSAIETYNYYAGGFFNLPVALIQDVQVLDPSSLLPIRSVDFTLQVNDPGLRYSAQETNTLIINDSTVALQPISISYVSDSSIAAVNNYLTQIDTRILSGNTMAKRMETLSVDVTISVRTTLTANAVASQIASLINSTRSTQYLTIADIVRNLYNNAAITYIDPTSLVLNGTYYAASGAQTDFVNVLQVFGSDTATYLANNISVTLL